MEGRGAAGMPHPVEAERVRRVALFYLALEREPFFLSPGADLGGLEQAASRLGTEERALLDLYKVRGPDRLYPAEFLAAYAAASAAFDGFSASPSEKNAREVLGKIRKCVEAYGAAAQAVSAAVARHFESRRTDLLAGVGGQNATDRQTILADFALIRENAAAARKRLSSLESCLMDSSERCSWGELSFRARQLPTVVLTPTPIMSPSDFAMDRKGLRGPYQVNTACWGGEQNYLYAYEQPSGRDGFRMEWDYLATDCFFGRRSISRSSGTTAAAGFTIMPFSATSSYGCNDLRYKPFLRTLDAFAVRYAVSPASAALVAPSAGWPAEQAAAINAAAAAERDFFTEPFPSQNGLERLGAAYFGAWKALERSKVHGRREYLARARTISLKTTGFALIVNRLAFTASNRNARVRAAAPRRPLYLSQLPYYFQARTAYSLTFMSFSPSVWVIPARPSYLASLTRAKSTYWLDYKQAVDLVGPAKVNEVMSYFAEHERYEKAKE